MSITPDTWATAPAAEIARIDRSRRQLARILRFHIDDTHPGHRLPRGWEREAVEVALRDFASVVEAQGDREA